MNTLHIVSHTHWDREWYLTLQQFRFRLVRTIDTLLDLLDRGPAYRSFTLDGQTIVLDDYLEIRPEQEGRIRRLVQEGRLLVGPWYVLPDEFLEGPEALVRNLLFGLRGCRRFSASSQPMERIGYIPDPFGHISQLPQVAAGFDMEALCFWRGVGDAPTEFRWAAPDGTERLVLHLRDSYSNAAWFAPDAAGFAKDLAGASESLAAHATTSHLLFMHGTDHMEARPDLPDYLLAAEQALGRRVRHSTLPAYLEAVRSELGPDGLSRLPLRQGELRSPQRAHLLPAVLSARMWIKQTNAECENLLTRWAEPFTAVAELLTGSQNQRGFLQRAWNWLLQNHPHDSICGCSVDQVHREMRTRFDWSRQIAEEVTESSLRAIAESTCPGSPSLGAPLHVVVFNPLLNLRTDRVRFRVAAVPKGAWHIADAEGRPLPHRLVTRDLVEHLCTRMDPTAFSAWLRRQDKSQGRIMGGPYFDSLQVKVEGETAFLEMLVTPAPSAGCAEALEQALGQSQALLAREEVHSFLVHVVEDCGAEIEFLARQLPSMGYAVYQLLPGRHPASAPGTEQSNSLSLLPHPQEPALIENEFLSVGADPLDGTLTITDKASGLTLRGANRFVDSGDQGDEYTFCPALRDSVIDVPSAPPVIRRYSDCLGSRFEISLAYRIPSCLAEGDRSSRSTETVVLPITSRITLTPGIRRVEFETTVCNEAGDHRLRVFFPTPIVTDRSWAEGHFDVVERLVAPSSDTAGWAEQPVGTHPQLAFVDVTDGQLGVMLANQGLPEYELLPANAPTAGVTIALTLLRCVGWLSRGDLHNRDGHAGPALETPEAQCPGHHTFRYALVPHTGNYLTAQREAHAFNAPLRAVVVGNHEGATPPSMSFLRLSPSAVVLSALKPPERGPGWIVRLYNSAAVATEAHLTLRRPFTQASLVHLHECDPIRVVATGSDSLAIPLRAKEIATLHIEFGE